MNDDTDGKDPSSPESDNPTDTSRRRFPARLSVLGWGAKPMHGDAPEETEAAGIGGMFGVWRGGIFAVGVVIHVEVRLCLIVSVCFGRTLARECDGWVTKGAVFAARHHC